MDRKKRRIKQIDELDEQKCIQKIGILPGPTKSNELRCVYTRNASEARAERSVLQQRIAVYICSASSAYTRQGRCDDKGVGQLMQV